MGLTRCDCCDKPLDGGYRVMFDRHGDGERICMACYEKEMEPKPLDTFDKVCIALLSVAFAALIAAQFLEV